MLTLPQTGYVSLQCWVCQRELSKGECVSCWGLITCLVGVPGLSLLSCRICISHERWGCMQEKKVCPLLLLVLNIASDLLGLDAFQLSEVLTQRSMILRGEEISSPLTVEQVGVLVYAIGTVTCAFPGPPSLSCIIHSSLGFPLTLPRCSAVSSSILPLLVVQVPVLTLPFRLYRGVHQMAMHNTVFKSPSLTRNWSCLCHEEGTLDALW